MHFPRTSFRAIARVRVDGKLDNAAVFELAQEVAQRDRLRVSQTAAALLQTPGKV